MDIKHGFSHNPQDEIKDTRYYVLCIGEDMSLMRTRRLILENKGYLVRAFQSENIAYCPTPSQVALTLLCHTLSELQLDDVLGWLGRNCPQAKVLLLEGPRAPKGHLWHLPRVSTQPADLLRSITYTLGDA